MKKGEPKGPPFGGGPVAGIQSTKPRPNHKGNTLIPQFPICWTSNSGCFQGKPLASLQLLKGKSSDPFALEAKLPHRSLKTVETWLACLQYFSEMYLAE